MKEPTTTSYALLGLLALRPWPVYELAKHIQRNLHFFWPRAERKLYDEPKVLVELGLARPRTEFTGRRPRTVYSITTKGRRALAAWLRRPPQPPALEVEGLVRVLLADQGTKDDLLAALRATEEQMEAMQAVGRFVSRQLLDGGGPFPERVHISTLVTAFLWEYTNAVRVWSRWAEETVRTWDDLSLDGKRPWVHRTLSTYLDRAGPGPERDPERV